MVMNGTIEATILALNRISLAPAQGILTDAVEKAAQPMLERAIQLCPVKTGNLKASLRIKVRKFKLKGGDIGAAATVQIGGKDFTGKTFYGMFVEFGHVLGKRIGDKGHDEAHLQRALEAGRRIVPPHPFLRPAFDENEAKSEDIAVDDIWEKISEAWAEG